MLNVEKYTEKDNQFYPTPESFLEQIEKDFYGEFKCFEKDCKYDIKVLEPSAGKGDIAIRLKKYGLYRRYGLYSSGICCQVECVEIDKTLQSTLRGLEFPVVHDDFLSFNPYTLYDLIYMNPPFENGEDHLLKAISLQERFGGRILCILNAETIKNPYSKKRLELAKKLNGYNAVIKYYNNAFNSYDSERRTAVETAVVWLDIPAPEQIFNSKIFDSLDKAKEIKIEAEETQEQRELIRMGLDWMSAIVKQYNEHVESALAFFKEYAAFESTYNARFSEIEKNGYVKPFELRIYDKKGAGINTYLEKTRRIYWKTIFDHPKFSDRLTSRLKNELCSRLDEFSKYDFNEHNILVLMGENQKATYRGIEEEILALFDRFTKNAQYDGCDNIHYYNGWKTNSAHKLNSKIVIPFYGAWKAEANYVGTNCWNMRKQGYTYHLDIRETVYTLTDMSKTLNYLANGVCGLEYDSLLEKNIRENFEQGNAKNIETQHFILTFYKKGTCHLKFKSQDLLDKFNLFASQRKGWLPPSYGKKSYADMSETEKEIVNEFSGSEEAYNKIFNNQKCYIVEGQELLQISQ